MRRINLRRVNAQGSQVSSRLISGIILALGSQIVLACRSSSREIAARPRRSIASALSWPGTYPQSKS
jgi:hypothetical protein